MELTKDNCKTGWVGFYKGHSFLSKSIEFFMWIFGQRKKYLAKWIPSHMLTLFVEGDTVKCGESVWPRYKINDFNSNYKKDFIIMKPKVDFTDEEIEIGKNYMIDLTAKGAYQWWKYLAYIWWVITGQTRLFKTNSDWNTVCYESATRVVIKMRPSLMPTGYNPEEAVCFDILNNDQFELVIDGRNN